MRTGYEDYPLDALPSKGRFYSEGTKIQIRPASTKEIENYSTMNEDVFLDSENQINEIIGSCSSITAGMKKMSYKDLLEGDKLQLLLAIRDRTFQKGENEIPVDLPCPSCKHDNRRNLNNTILDATEEEDEELEKYYSEEQRCYVIKTKSYGEVILHPPRVGVTKAVVDWGVKQQQDKKEFDRGLVTLIPYLIKDYRKLESKDGLNERMFSNIDADIKTWDKTKYAIVYRMAEKIKVGADPKFKISCDNCGEVIEQPFRFPTGKKSLFIISDISGELL